jgi:hypothetical protein
VLRLGAASDREGSGIRSRRSWHLAAPGADMHGPARWTTLGFSTDVVPYIDYFCVGRCILLCANRQAFEIVFVLEKKTAPDLELRERFDSKRAPQSEGRFCR